MPIRALLSAVLLAARSAAADDCPWTGFEAEPQVKQDEGVIEYTHAVPREFWKCARKAGGKATVEILVGDGDALQVRKTQGISGASFRIGAYRNFLCDNKARKVQFRVTGTGAMEPLKHETPPVEVDAEMCPRCEYKSWETSFGIMFTRSIELNIGVDPAWFDCAKEGSTWQVRFFTGDDKEALRKKSAQPVFVYDLMGKPKHIREAIPYEKVCQGGKPKFWGYDAVGTGELKRVSMQRVVNPARCP